MATGGKNSKNSQAGLIIFILNGTGFVMLSE